MGWAGGSGLAEELWQTIRKYVPKEKRKALAIKWIDIFENEDCDTMDETSFYKLSGRKAPWEDDEEEYEEDDEDEEEE